ncbi:NrfD/PsrC family molybdoenzyme membrane anchor subunit [Infirmifilum sp. NZ]|uniref:NrfD/PsrC family molybdoenzyme membrane anchor subunit n=1 Tax=Infirmifilum sp. NZ TaxID=2926850 RepID=UPI0027A1E10A|nr:NrfD/PsrC family molybdoenzyme membrane anchor subunit [Infirmifilum sp. NZ]UNQ73282.1 polysulfide reductase NrfD [Infirmifilum sp. NZ]
MSFQEVWTPFLIGPFLWFAGIAGMGSVAYALMRFAKVEEKLRELSLTVFGSVVLALLFVVADLSRPANMPLAILGSLASGVFLAKLTVSWMTLGISLLFLLLLATLALALRHTALPAMAKLTDNKYFLAVLALIGLLVTLYSGFLVSSAPGVPFWNTSLIPILWLISASICAVAVLKILVHDERVTRFLTTSGLALDVAELAALAALINVALYSGSVAAKMSAEALLVGELAAAFWIGLVLLGVLAPLALGFLLLKKEDRRLALAAAVLGLLGALVLRTLVIQAGIFEVLGL